MLLIMILYPLTYSLYCTNPVQGQWMPGTFSGGFGTVGSVHPGWSASQTCENCVTTNWLILHVFEMWAETQLQLLTNTPLCHQLIIYWNLIQTWSRSQQGQTSVRVFFFILSIVNLKRCNRVCLNQRMYLA